MVNAAKLWYHGSLKRRHIAEGSIGSSRLVLNGTSRLTPHLAAAETGGPRFRDRVRTRQEDLDSGIGSERGESLGGSLRKASVRRYRQEASLSTYEDFINNLRPAARVQRAFQLLRINFFFFSSFNEAGVNPVEDRSAALQRRSVY
jgi:hypothetical protein